MPKKSTKYVRTIKKYGLKLKDKKNLLQYSMTPVDPSIEFCTSIRYELEEYGDGDWLVDTEDDVLYVMYNPQKYYYNETYQHPKHYYKPEDLEVVEVEQFITEQGIKYKFVNITLKEEYVLSGEEIPYYNSEEFFDVFYIANQVCNAIDRGEYYQILKIDNTKREKSLINYKFDKKYFDIIED
jgi:hypothetical protein